MMGPHEARAVIEGWFLEDEDLDNRMEAGLALEELRAEIDLAVDDLRLIAVDPTAMGRLHPIEQLMVHGVLQENRHLRCRGCLTWMRRLAAKATAAD